MYSRQTTTLSQSKEQSSYLCNYIIDKDFVQVPNLNLEKKEVFLLCKKLKKK